MTRILVALMLLAGCSRDDPAAQGNGAAPIGVEGKAQPDRGALASLTGLYEGGNKERPNQLCIVGDDSQARFGLVVWGGNLHSCSGSGTVTRAGDTLTLSMAGDEACAIDARIRGTTVTLPSSVPNGCSYYCGARAALTGAAFTQKGGTEADARKAVDLVGDPLCAGS